MATTMGRIRLRSKEVKMIRLKSCVLLCSWLLLSLSPVESSAQSGTKIFQIGQVARSYHPAEPRNWRGSKNQALNALVWYPTLTDSKPVLVEIGPVGHKLFKGHPLVESAAVAPGSHPLILLSHGTGGSAESLDWLAAALAERGYIVVGVNHPGNNAMEPLTATGFQLWWERATDVRQTLDEILKDPQFAAAIDPNRIGALGFSLGGYTVLELAGAITDRDALVHFCKSKSADAICTPPEMRALSPTSRFDESDPDTAQSIARSADSYRDPRIHAVFAIAPALGMAFGAANLASIAVPVKLVAGDADVTVPVDTNISRYARLIPGASTTLIPGAGHYIFLDECLPEGKQLLATLCRDTPGLDRGWIHQETIELAVNFFASHL